MDKKLILLVEDNPDDELLAMRALTKGNIVNMTAVVRDGQEALDYIFCEGIYADRTGGNPQVILLDLKLPKVDGMEVLRRIRATESTKLIPVVILTSSSAETDIATGYGSGANSYLVKPVDIEQFSKIIQHFLLYWIGINSSMD